MDERDTIFALSSGRPPAAIAVVRISGPRTEAALRALTGKIPSPRKAALARIRDPQTNDIIDQALALWFPAPHSETGEDVAELQLHGGRAVIAATLAALGRVDGLRAAEAGEFTRRAFENGKFDLTAVEGLADLVMAETEGQRRQALRQLQGALGNRAEDWRQRLIDALALVEARIDFSDEADVPGDLLKPALAVTRSLADEIAGALADEGRGERLREGLVVAIAGPPNAGKSTLLNRIARREAAIVSPYAGTTRDVIEVHLDLDGWPVTLLDTAGIRETDDPVELEGVRRAHARAEAADLVLWVVDAREAQSPAVIPGRRVATNPEAITPVDDDGVPARAHSASQTRMNALTGAPRNEENPGPPVWLIRNKIDLLSAEERVRLAPASSGQTTSDRAIPEPSAPNRQPTPAPAGPAAPPTLPNGRGSERPSPARATAAVAGSAVKSNEISALAAPSGARATPAPLRQTPASAPAAQKNESVFGVAANNEQPAIPIKPLRSLVNPQLPQRSELIFNTNEQIFGISAASGEGFDALLHQLTRQAEQFLGGGEPALITRQRHRQALENTLAALRRALSDEVRGHEDLVAEELRSAAQALGRLTGRVDVEDILDVIFRDFCIGK